MKLDKRIRKAGRAVLDFDERAQALFKPHSESAAIRALHPVSKLGDQPALRTLCAAMIIAGVLLRSQRLARAGSRMIIAHEAATFAKDMIKINVDRNRPRSAETRDQKKPRPGKHKTKELSSFPSGHSAGAIAVARAFSREFPEHGAAATAAAAIIAALQIPRCAHYPSDVVAGLAIGLAAEGLVEAGWTAARIDERSDLAS